MNVPAVSIGLPVYNGAESLGRALNSVLQQDFADFELIISDNASTDGTRAICESFTQRDQRIRYFRNFTNIGVNPNHNRVFQLSTGKYFTWFAHDLEYLPGMLGRCIDVIRSAPSAVVLVYPRCEIFDQSRTLGDLKQLSIESSDPRPYVRAAAVMQRTGVVTEHYGLFVSDVLRKTRLLGSFRSADYVLSVEMAMLGELREIPEVLIRRTMAPDNGTVSRRGGALLAWLDSRAGNHRVRLPERERLAFEYSRAALRLPLRPIDKLLCMLLLPCLPYWRILLRITGPWRHKLGLRRRVRRAGSSKT